MDSMINERWQATHFSLLDKPPTDATVATKLTAVGTEMSFLQLLHTDEAAKHIDERLRTRKSQ